MKQVAIYGASGCGRGVMPLARSIWRESKHAYQLAFVDDNPELINPELNSVNGHPIFLFDDWMSQSATSRHISIAIANSRVREQLAQRCADAGVQFFEVRAANVVQLDEVEIGEGAILCPFVTLTSNIRIGKHFHANLYSYVEHDCVIGDFVTFAPGVKCNGNVVIEDHTYIGTGAVIKQGSPGNPLVIGRGAVVGMGAVVTKSVPPGVTVVGNPARPM